MTLRFWHGPLMWSPHQGTDTKQNIPRCFAIVMSDFNQQGKLLQQKKYLDKKTDKSGEDRDGGRGMKYEK